VLAVVRSELTALVGFLTGEGLQGAGDRRLKAACVKCARALLRGSEGLALPHATAQQGEGPDAAAEALRTLLEEQVVALSRALGLEGEGGCDSLTAPERRAERLRADLWVMASLCRATAQRLRAEPPAEGHRALEGLRRFLLDFQEVGFQLLRFGDMPPFERGAALIHEPLLPPDGQAQRERMADDCTRLGQMAESTFTSVSRRAQLRAASFDRAAAEAVRDRYLPR
jgi:hypothetical protein